jgi:hypothetical protein
MADQVNALLNGIAIGGMLGYAFAMLYTFKRVDAIAERLREAREELARLKLLDRLNAKDPTP